jgi:CBS domain-containing protein
MIPFTGLAGHTGTGQVVADAMIRGPKTHDLDTGVHEIRAFFEDDHVHMALIVAPDRRLVTTIERPDVPASSPGSSPAAELGTLAGRTADPAQALDVVTAGLLRERRRRLAVVDDGGRLLGLLCLKRDGSGYCSDEGIRQRQTSRAGTLPRSRIRPTYRA